MSEENIRLCRLTETDVPSVEGLTVNEYQISGGGPNGEPDIRLCRRPQMQGPDKWAVYRNGSVLSKQGHWIYEPLPSSRDDEFLRQCRFDTPEEALDALARLEQAKGGGDE